MEGGSHDSEKEVEGGSQDCVKEVGAKHYAISITNAQFIRRIISRFKSKGAKYSAGYNCVISLL